MRNLFIVLALVGLFGLACSKDKPEPDCDECPDCEGCEVPEPPPDPPPPDPGPPPIPGPGPDLYLHLSRGEKLVNGTSSKEPGLYAETQDLEVNGRKAILAVLSKCSWSTADGRYPFFKMTSNEMAGLAVEVGQWVKESRSNYQKRLLEPNKRCNPKHAEYHEDYCTRSDVRKTAWRQWHAGFKSVFYRALSLEGEVAHCRKFLNENFDNVRGWCNSMNRANKKTCP